MFRRSAVTWFASLATFGATACGGGGGGGGGSSDAGQPLDYFTIPLVEHNNVFYTANVTLPTGQTFATDIDTGSTTMAVAGASCTTCSGVSPLYTPASSAVDQHQTAQAEYADGTGWMGEIYKDSVSLANGTPDVVMRFVDISENDQSSQDGASFLEPNGGDQGIIGLAPKGIAVAGTDSYVDGLVAASGKPNLLAFELCDGSGAMFIGGFDKSLAGSAVVYTLMVQGEGFYQMDVDSMNIGSAVVGDEADEFEHPVIDTGTTLIALPTGLLDNLISVVQASDGFQTLFGSGAQFVTDDRFGLQCIQATGVTADMVNTQMPPMTLSLPAPDAGVPGTISAPALSSYFEQIGTGGEFCLTAFDSNGNGSIFGDRFMDGYLTVIDVATHQIGFAPDTGCAGSASEARSSHVVLDPDNYHPRAPRASARRTSR